VRLLVDNQLPSALARWLVSLGCDSVHVTEVGLELASDAEIWRYACANERIIISKDEDFLFRAHQESRKAGLIWVRLGNCRTKELLSAFEQLWPRIESALRAGERIIEVR
jgi:predicted nuclease of predicted toxin-antitoxin system